MKALVADNDDRILGFTMIGAEAGDVMAVVETAMLAGLPYMRLREAVLAHPTMAEGLGFLLRTCRLARQNDPGRDPEKSVVTGASQSSGRMRRQSAESCR